MCKWSIAAKREGRVTGATAHVLSSAAAASDLTSVSQPGTRGSDVRNGPCQSRLDYIGGCFHRFGRKAMTRNTLLAEIERAPRTNTRARLRFTCRV
jgi:hypothetical protein